MIDVIVVQSVGNLPAGMTARSFSPFADGRLPMTPWPSSEM
jgi:hypothetical protein